MPKNTQFVGSGRSRTGAKICLMSPSPCAALQVLKNETVSPSLSAQDRALDWAVAHIPSHMNSPHSPFPSRRLTREKGEAKRPWGAAAGNQDATMPAWTILSHASPESPQSLWHHRTPASSTNRIVTHLAQTPKTL